MWYFYTQAMKAVTPLSWKPGAKGNKIQRMKRNEMSSSQRVEPR